MKKETEILKTVKRYKTLYARLDCWTAAHPGEPMVGRVAALFMSIMELEENIIEAYSIPFTQEHQKILWRDDPGEVINGLEEARERWEKRPVKDPILYFLYLREKEEINTHDMLRILGYQYDHYNIYLFKEHLMSEITYDGIDIILQEMNIARMHLDAIRALMYNGIIKEHSKYKRLCNKGLIHLDDFLIYHDKFDLPKDEITAVQLSKRAMRNLSRRKYSEALDDLNREIDLEPDDANAIYNRGVVYGEMGLEDEALADFDRAIDADPQYYHPYINRGLIHAQRGLLEEAIEDFTAAIKLRNDCSEAFINRGNTYALIDDHEFAVTDFSTALWLDHGLPDIYCNRGVSYYQMDLMQLAHNDIVIAALMGSENGKRALKDLFDEDVEKYQETQH